MSVLTSRGGIPHVFRETITTTVRKHGFPFYSNYLIVRSDAAVRLYFTEADATADANYVEIPAPAAATPHGEWQGPAELCDVWLATSAGSANIELVAFQRRG